MVEEILTRQTDMEQEVDLTIEICGSSGDGSIAAGQMLNLAMTGIGLHVMNFDSYDCLIISCDQNGFNNKTNHAKFNSKCM